MNLGISIPEKFYKSYEIYRYSIIIMLTSWEEIYTFDNVKHEELTQSMTNYNHHFNPDSKLNYKIIEVLKQNLEKRVHFNLVYIN